MSAPAPLKPEPAAGDAPAPLDDARLLAAVMRQMPASVLILGAPDGHVLACSDALRRIYGERVDAIRSWRDLAALGIAHADGTPYAAEEYPVARALLHGEAFEGETYTVRHASGGIGWSRTWTAPVRDDAGRVVAAVGAAVDVTAAREAEARLRALVEALPQLVWSAAADGTCDYLSPQWTAYTGVPEAEHRGLGWQDAIHPEDRARAAAAWAEAMAGDAAYDVEYRLRRHDGAYRWFKARGAWVRGPDGAPGGIFGTSTDIDDIKSAEAALRESQALLRDALDARELTVREADHRIRNSLQMVGSLISLQRSRLPDSAAEAAAALDDATARVRAVGEVHRALERSPDLRTVAFGDMLRTICALLGGLNAAVEFRCRVPEAFELDAERAIPLGLMANELLTNAAKYAYPDGAAGWVRLDAAEADGVLTLTVRDGGAGLPDDAPPSLGATITRALARRIGATLRMRSAPGEGTEATVSLPVRAA